jgi:hypothetical protein
VSCSGWMLVISIYEPIRGMSEPNIVCSVIWLCIHSLQDGAIASGGSVFAELC